MNVNQNPFTEEAGYGDPLGGDPLGDYFAKDFNIIKFMSDSE